jgi:hypothetical protein
VLASLWPWTVHTYTWPGPFGWVARETPGNLAAGFIQTAIAAVIASLVWPPSRKAIHRFIDRKLAPLHAKADKAAGEAEKLAAHSKWMATHLARDMASRGVRVDAHPEHGDLTADLTLPAAEPPTP